MFRRVGANRQKGGVIIVSDVHPDAIQRGWKRSFETGTETIEVTHERYQFADLSHPSLTMASLVEPRFGEPERCLFEQAGHGASFTDCSRDPAIFVATWVKTDA